MEWKAKDIDVFLQEKEYIDTAVIPLIPIAFGQNMKQIVEKGEFIQLLSLYLERQFKGRMFFLPPFTYFEHFQDDEKATRLQEWESKTKEFGFKYVFFLTSDQIWRDMEGFSSASLLYVPSIPMEHMDEQYKKTIMEDQVKELLKAIVKGWQSSD